MVMVPSVVKMEAFEYFASEVPDKLIAETGCPGYLVSGPEGIRDSVLPPVPDPGYQDYPLS